MEPFEPNRSSPLFGFPVDWKYRFYLQERLFRINPDGVQTLNELLELLRAKQQATQLTWPLSQRDRINTIIGLDCKAVLCLVIQCTTSEDLRQLAIWLRGRCGGYLGTEILFRFRTSSDPRLRKEMVRALHKLHAWSQLRLHSEIEPIPRIQRMASSNRIESHRSRLNVFRRNLSTLSVPRKKAALYVDPSVKIITKNKHRSPSVLRLLLERIHRLVASSSILRKQT